MNCAEFQIWLQNRMDGVAGSPQAAFQHLEVCPECRTWHLAAERLETGLALLHWETPNALVERIVTEVLADRRARLRRMRMHTVAGALAASVAIATLALAFIPRWLNNGNRESINQPVAVNSGELKSDSTASASARVSMAEGQLAVASLANRAKEETLKQTRLLFPVAEAALPFDKMSVPSSLDGPADPLSEAGKGVSEGLKPVATSARRAWDLFLRGVPPIESTGKSNS